MNIIQRLFKKIARDFSNTYYGFICLFLFIRQKKKDDVFVFMTDSIGDDIYALALMNQFKESCHGQLTLFCERRREMLVNAYSGIYDHLELLDNNNRKHRLIFSFHRCKLAIIIGKKHNIFSTMPYHLYPIRGKSQENNIQLIGKKMLDLNDPLRIQFPKFDNIKIESINNFEVISNKTIILNYGSKSMSNYSMELFCRMAEDLSKKGYALFSNVVAGQEAVNFTKALNCSIYEFYAICKKARAVVSVRSGILDLIAGLDTPLMVIYFPLPTAYGQVDKTEKFMKRFTMTAWGRKNTSEFRFESNDQMFELYKNWFKKYL